jgi:hypothetical protein
VADQPSYFIEIRWAGPGTPPPASRLELLVDGDQAELTEFNEGYSLLHPADSENDGMVTVGALGGPAYNDYFQLLPISSQGPNKNGRIKPDLAASGLAWDIAPNAGGTSFAGPYVAGAAALVRQVYPGMTPAQLRTFLINRAVDMGAAGPDNMFGYGRVAMGSVPSSYAAAVLADQPLAYFRLDDQISTYANNSGGDGAAGTLAGTLTTGLVGAVGTDSYNLATGFSGSLGHVILPKSFNNASSGLTVEAWIYPTARANWARIIDLGNGQGRDNIIFARLGTSSDLHRHHRRPPGHRAGLPPTQPLAARCRHPRRRRQRQHLLQRPPRRERFDVDTSQHHA